MKITSIDFKKLFSTRNITIIVSAALVLALTFTLVFCTKKNEDETPGGGDQTGQVTPDNGTPDNGETETPDSGDTTDTPDSGNTPDNTPDGGDTTDKPEHSHSFVEGKCECGESDPNYVPEPSKPDSISYEEYLAMTPAEQEAYFNLFEDFNDFFAWLNAAKAEHEQANAGNGPTLGEDGSLDVGDIFGD